MLGEGSEAIPLPIPNELIANGIEAALEPWIQSGEFGIKANVATLEAWDDPFARGEGPPIGQVNTARITLSGSIIGAPEGIPVQVDLIDRSEDKQNSNNPLVGSARFDHVDNFEMPAPTSGDFAIRVYLDREADGPSANDPVYLFDDPPIRATGQSMKGLRLNLTDQQMDWITPDTTSLGPQ